MKGPGYFNSVEPIWLYRRRYLVLDHWLSMHTLVIVPTYNEIENIQAFLDQVLSVTPPEVEVLVVDDGSPDGTGKLVMSLGQENPRIHLLERTRKLGLGLAYVAGFKWGITGGYDALIEMDADFSHHPKYLPPMLDYLKQYDFVIGSRYVKGGGTVNWGLSRKFISRAGSFYSRTILGAPIWDFTGGFNGWNRKVLTSIELDTIRSDGYSFQIELKYRSFSKGFEFFEFPIVFEDRRVGQSKMSNKIVFDAVLKVWEFRSLPRSGLENST
jgi:dolichol-phosphate mannosyltransferase